MRPIVRTALVVAGVAAVAKLASWLSPPPESRQQHPAVPGSASAARSECPPGTLPDGRACIPVPDDPSPLAPTEPTRDHSSAIPRRPDRPREYDRYQWPVDLTAEGVISPEPPVPGALLIPQQRGAPVRALQLRHQVGDAALLAVSNLVGTTVVTLHTLRHPGGLRQYLVLYGRLSSTGAALKAGASLPSGTVLGKVGDSGQPGDVHLYLEVRQVRGNVDLTQLPVAEIRHPARTVPCDPRNVFPSD